MGGSGSFGAAMSADSAQNRSEIESGVTAAGRAAGQFAGHHAQHRTGCLQFLTDRSGNCGGECGNGVLRWFDTVDAVLFYVGTVQLVDPVGLLIDERVYFLRRATVFMKSDIWERRNVYLQFTQDWEHMYTFS